MEDIIRAFEKIPKLLGSQRSVTRGIKEEIERICRDTIISCKILNEDEVIGKKGANEGSVELATMVRAEVKDAVKEAMRSELGRAVAAGVAPPQNTYAQTMAAGYSVGKKKTPFTTTGEATHARPAIIVSYTGEGAPREQIIKALRKLLPYEKTKYTPASIQKLSNGKAKVEFDAELHKEDALERIRGASPAMNITAEGEKKLSPLIILKGISKDLPFKEIVPTLLEQNAELEGCSVSEISGKFERRNRNSNLYNAVLTVTPRIWRTLINKQRVALGFQRVHVEDFPPYVQCFKCQQFGHTQARCEAPRLCAHCGLEGHRADACPTAAEPPRCNSCATHNIRFRTNWDISHSALNMDCPRYRTIVKRIINRVDYGSQQW